MTLTQIPYRDKAKKARVRGFGGYRHTRTAADGELWDMENLSFDHYPALSPRPARRQRIATFNLPAGILGGDKLAWVNGTGFYYDNALLGQVSSGRKTLLQMGVYLLIFPDKKYYRLGRQGTAWASLAALNAAVTAGQLTPGYGDIYGVSVTGGVMLYYWDNDTWQKLRLEFGPLESSWQGSVTLADGELNGEAATANSISNSSVDWPAYFQAGDGISLSGCGEAANNKTLILREISADGHTLRFSENALTLTNTDGDTEAAVTLARRLPQLDYVCVNENRLWGCAGKNVYGSKLGDPFNFNVFDGLADDSWAVQELSSGDFTAAYSYLGYPIFFKEKGIFKVYGSRPDNFQITGSSEQTGVAAGSGASLAVAGNTLFYLSPQGVMAYQGGVPESLAAPLGTARYRNGVAGADGVCYYLSAQDENDAWQLLVYDSRWGLWRREDNTAALAWANYGGALYCLEQTGKLWYCGHALSAPPGSWRTESGLSWWAETADFYFNSPEPKAPSGLALRCELDSGGSLTVQAQWDSSGLWETVASLTATSKRLYTLPIVPRRCDHVRFKLSGSGQGRLYELVIYNS